MKLRGSKKGGARIPKEAKDTIQTSGEAYITDMLCEGPISGLVNGKQSVYIDDVPLENPDGSTDFNTITWEESLHFRTGEDEDNQSVLPSEFSGATIPLPLPKNTTFRFNVPMVIEFNNTTFPDAVAFRINFRTGPYFKTDESKRKFGDILPTEVTIKIELFLNDVTSPSISKDVTINEKSSGGFLISETFPLPRSGVGSSDSWRLVMTRQTEDSISNRLNNEVMLDGVIALTNNRYKYPHTVLSAITFDAKSFPTIPQRSYELRLKKVQVPTNYTPTQYNSDGTVSQEAQYDGIWDGTFKADPEWTDNPAWVFYDLLTNKRYGLGEYLDSDNIDKWTLYSISQYCDELVEDGFGGEEPRFTANFLLTTTEEAYSVIKHIASIFRGMTYWMSNKVFVSQDKLQSSKQIFTNANVINGTFNYSSTEKIQRRNQIDVRWNDPKNNYHPAFESVQDPEGIIEAGGQIRSTQTAAFGCTSRGQAHRAGKWSLLTERLEQEIVTFDCGFEGIYARPGNVIEIYDDFRILQKQGGRTIDMNAAQNIVQLDRVVTAVSGLGYSLYLQIPTGNRDPAYTGTNSGLLVTGTNQTGEIFPSFIECRDVSGFAIVSGKTSITTTSGFSSRYIGGVWTLDATHPTSGKIYGTKPYRVLSIAENEDKSLKVTALEYDPTKYGIVESGFTVSTFPSINYSGDIIAAPTGLTLEEVIGVQNDEAFAYIQANWFQSTGTFVSHHIASGRHIGSSDWTNMFVTDNTSARFFIDTIGLHEISVQAVQIGGKISERTTGQIQVATGNPFGGPTPLSGILLVNPYLENDLSRFEERVADIDVILDETGDGDIRTAFISGLQLYFVNEETHAIIGSAQIPETNEFSVPWENPFPGWPDLRRVILSGHAVDLYGTLSSGVTLVIENPPPPTGTMTIVNETVNKFSYILEPLDDVVSQDFSGVLFWTTSGDTFPGFENYSHIRHTLGAGTITHNLGVTGVNAWFAIADDMTYSGLNINGPFKIGAIGIPTGAYVLTNNTHLDSESNEQSSLHATWPRFDDEKVIGYDITFTDGSGEVYRYKAQQPASGTNPTYIFESPVAGREYSFTIQANTQGGAGSPELGPSNTIDLPEPIMRHLAVHGDSDFRNRTAVHMPIYDNVANDLTVDFYESNISIVHLWNSNSITISPSNVATGATYIVHLIRHSGEGDVSFSSEFKWPDGVPPAVPTTSGTAHLISATSRTGELTSVFNENFS